MRGNYYNNDEAKLAAYKSDDTNDKVFLLSVYGPDHNLLSTVSDRQLIPTDYALATRVRRGKTPERYGYWLTRTPRCDNDGKNPDLSPYRYKVLHFKQNGNDSDGDTDYPGIVGIAPALTIDPSYLP